MRGNKISIKISKWYFLLQELITQENTKFLIIGIGLNILSNPNINNAYKATNIYLETKKKPSIIEIINLIILSYEKFFLNLNSYKYEDFKKKAEALSIKNIFEWKIF